MHRSLDSDFINGVDRVLNNADYEWADWLTDDQIEGYFKLHNKTKRITLTSPDNACLPVRRYYKQYNDAVRLFLNDQSTYTQGVRHEFNRNMIHQL